MAQLQCILHPPETDCPEEDVQLFDEVKWAKVQAAATRRQKLLKLSKCSGIYETLPEAPSPSDGYHNTCYYRFTAIASETEVPATTSKDRKFLRSQSTQLKVSSSGVLPKVCIFCSKARKKVEGNEQPLTSSEYDSVEKNIKEAAQVLNDNDMLVKIGNVGFHSKEVKYHNVCKRRYLNDMRDELKKANAPPAEDKQVNSAALTKKIFMYIESSVIDNRRPEYLVSLHRHYCQYLERESDGDVAPHTVRTLGEKIVQHIGDRVKLDFLAEKKVQFYIPAKPTKSWPFPWLQNAAQPKNVL